MYIEVSAKQNINIEELFGKIAEKFPIIVEVEEKKIIVPKILKIDDNKKKKCCWFEK